MVRNASNSCASVGQAAIPSPGKQQPRSTALSQQQDSTARVQEPSSATRVLPYQPAHQVELLNLHAELDALQYHLDVACETQPPRLITQ